MFEQKNLKDFEQIYNDTYKLVLNYVICKCSNIDDVNDIVQDIYCDLYYTMKKNNNVLINNIHNYLIGIAKNKIKKHYKIRYKFKEISLFNKLDEMELIDTVKEDIDIDKIVINQMAIETIWKTLKKKKIIIFKIFHLYYVLDMTIKEIANELKISESNVKNYLYRTLQELQNTLGKECD